MIFGHVSSRRTAFSTSTRIFRSPPKVKSPLLHGRREDSVGKLARRWVSESAGDGATDCEAWLSDLEHDADWQTAAGEVRKEYAVALDFLSRGKSAPSFPRLFASEKHDQLLNES